MRLLNGGRGAGSDARVGVVGGVDYGEGWRYVDKENGAQARVDYHPLKLGKRRISSSDSIRWFCVRLH